MQQTAPSQYLTTIVFCVCLGFSSSGCLSRDPTSNSDASILLASRDTADAVGKWPVYGGDAGGSRFSALTEINADNVSDLQLAWQYRTGDSSELREDVPPSSFLATPVLHDNTLFFCSGLSRAFAVDAETGEERWVFDSQPNFEDTGTAKCRGVSLWQQQAAQSEAQSGAALVQDAVASGATPCQVRVFMGTLDARLVAIDAATGLACRDFGNEGFVDLRDGMGDVIGNEMAMTSPAVVVGDLVIQGAMVRDNQRVDPPGGVIRAWDARTGELRWAFDPVPPNAPTPQALGAPAGQHYHRGTPNAWTIMSADIERQLVFVPFGSPGLDFIGGHRKRHGFDYGYYANSVVALHAQTGEVVWHFQTVHHDLWDYDLASQPLLVDIEVAGAMVPVVVQATKMGHVFVLHRETGKPVFPVEERSVPQTTIPGEYTSPTQPFPSFPPPVHPHDLETSDAWGMFYFDKRACRKKMETADNFGIFTPPALNRFNIQYPGVAGGQNWGGVVYDRERNLLIMPQNYVVTLNKILPREEAQSWQREKIGHEVSPNTGTPFVIVHDLLLSPIGIPCVKPPWGSLLALSLETGELRWEVPFGTLRDVAPLMSLVPFVPDFGFPSAGGPILTGTGLVFIGAAMDNYIRAYAVATGEELWRARLPAGGQATPMTYQGRRTGKQFVVIAAGGHAYMRTRLGDSLMAFALPEASSP